MSRKRVNITIESDLHSEAGVHARKAHGTDFSGLVTKLLIADLGDAYLQKNLTSKSSDTIALLKRVASEEKARLPMGPRAQKQSVLEASARRMVDHATKTVRKKGATRVARKGRGAKKQPHGSAPA